MASFTSFLHLRKPATTDTVNVTTDIGDNMDLIDAGLAQEITDRQSAVSSEASTRATADTTNATAITAEATRATAAELALRRTGGAWVALGDSITIGSSDNANNLQGDAWPTYASLISQQRLKLVHNSGVSGNASAAMITRFASDVTAYSPRIVTILAGTNDIGTGVTFATFKTNIQSLVASCLAIGATPVLATIPPRDAGGYGPTIVQWNTWLTYYAHTNGYPLLDFYRLLTDPSNGHYLSAYYSDGIHPNAAGARAMGELAAYTLEGVVPPVAPAPAVDATDTNDLLLGNGLFLTAAGSGVGTGWTPGSAPTGVTKSVVAVAGVLGNMQKIVCASASGLWDQTVTVSSGFSVGDRIRAIGVVTADGGTQYEVIVSFTGAGSGSAKPVHLTQDVVRGVFFQELTVPAGTTAIVLHLTVGVGSGFTSTVYWGQVGLYNLTTMGTLT